MLKNFFLIWSCPVELTGQSSVQANTVLNTAILISDYLNISLLVPPKQKPNFRGLPWKLNIYKGQQVFPLTDEKLNNDKANWALVSSVHWLALVS